MSKRTGYEKYDHQWWPELGRAVKARAALLGIAVTDHINSILAKEHGVPVPETPPPRRGPQRKSDG